MHIASRNLGEAELSGDTRVYLPASPPATSMGGASPGTPSPPRVTYRPFDWGQLYRLVAGGELAPNGLEGTRISPIGGVRFTPISHRMRVSLPVRRLAVPLPPADRHAKPRCAQTRYAAPPPGP